MGNFGKIFAIALFSSCFLCIQSENDFLECDFSFHATRGYTCLIRGANLNENANVIGITGNHMAGRGNQDVVQLEILSSNLNAFPQVLLNEFTKLERLIMYNTNLENFPVFKNCSSLNRFDFRFRPVRTIRNSTFEECKNLRSLWMMQADINHIELDAFKGLTNLANIIFAFNKLKTIDGRVFKPLQSLVNIDFQLNELQSINEDTFVHLRKLQFLGLGQNRISNIARNFLENFQSLNVLELRNNLCVNQDFSNVLRNFDFVREQLEPCFAEIPSSLVNCQFLATSAGYTCLIEGFNSEFHTFVAGGNHVPGRSNLDVKIVRFSNSKLQTIPESIFTDFPNVRDLNLNGTRVESYPEIKNCGSLSKIIISSNELTDIPNGLFKNCANLNTIDLSRNLMTRIPCGLFLQNSKLQTVDFSFNRIAAIEPCFMDDLRFLSEIRLLGNSCSFENFFIRNQEDLDRIENRLNHCFRNWN